MSNNEKQEKCLYCKFSQKSHLDFPCYECRVIDNLEEKTYFVLSEASKYNVEGEYSNKAESIPAPSVVDNRKMLTEFAIHMKIAMASGKQWSIKSIVDEFLNKVA